jgi:hypothetical protein
MYFIVSKMQKNYFVRILFCNFAPINEQNAYKLNIV